MELKASSQKPDLVSSDHNDEPEDKEISEGEDEDDDRNHKHRRREEHSQSLEGDTPDQCLPRTFRKRNRPSENGYSFREGDPQAGVAWKTNDANPERDFSSRHEKKRTNQASFSRAPSDWNQRIRGNLMSGEAGPSRGRGRGPVSWNVRDSSFGFFAGMGFPNVSNSPNVPWNGFGLFPGISNGVIDAVNPLGLPGGLGPVIASTMNLGIARQRCPDFEERGFCLRGDMCPMDHGFNRIVVEDVQSLSQFNLPASLPGLSHLGPCAQVAMPVTTGASVPLVNNDGLGLNGGRFEASDVYDPDQPLWNKDNPRPSNVDETESSISGNPSNRRTDVMQTVDSVGISSISTERVKREEAINTDLTDSSHQGKLANVAAIGHPVKESSLKHQKALRTLFVSGIPTKDNKREALLSHFKKFGEVISIHIPMQSERAFVQFSKREEAEAALKAPDAVMGNRFIKLFWANRDNIAVDVMSGKNTVPLTSHGVTHNLGLTRQLVVDKSKKNLNSAGGKERNAHGSGDNPKAVVGSVPSPLQQKKLESLETLKAELRKKQEMLEQKRNEFQRQLDKLHKQAVDSNEVEKPPSHLKLETANLSLKDSTNPTSISVTDQKVVPNFPTTNTTTSSQEPYRPVKPRVSTWAPNAANRFKLDNRPTAFKVIPPLPARIANVDALKEHFSTFGDLSSLELEEDPNDENDNDDAEQSRISARVHFSSRHSAEKAFSHGKSFEGQKMQFKWLPATTNNSNENSGACKF